MNIGLTILLIGIALLAIGIMVLVLYIKVMLTKPKKGGAIKKTFITTVKAVVSALGVKLLIIDILVTILGGILAYLGLNLMILQSQWTTVATVVTHGDSECTCAVKCSNDSNDDVMTSYELLYGTNEYSHMLARVFRAYQIRELNSLQSGTEKSNYILENANWDEFSEEELKALQDRKENGRNTQCPVCNDLGDQQLKSQCNGADPYIEGWTWSKTDITTEDYFGGDDSGNNSSSIGDGGGGTPSNATSQGNATGAYAVQLDDGMYYWYHQGGPSCNNICGGYCGDWSHTMWGESRKWFGNNGCAVYSLAIAISNLLGQEITPTQILYDLGCTPHDENGVRVWETSSANFAAPGVDIKRPNAIETLARKYGFQYKALTDDVASWDEILDKGGYIWNSWWDAQCEWCQSTKPRDSHFMVIRKKEGDNYYCFTSCRGRAGGGLSGKEGAIATMNVPINKQTVVSTVKNANAGWGIWLDEPVSGGSGTIELSPDGWYSDVTGTRSTETVSLGGNLKLYTGLPWNASSSAGVYMLDTDIATTDLYSWLTGQGANIQNSLEWALTSSGRLCKGVGPTANIDDYPNRWGGWNYSASPAALKQLDGVYCVGIAPAPTVVYRDYNDQFKHGIWQNTSSMDQSYYSDLRIAIVLEKKSDGKTYYLPATPADAKAHTFPGGIVQTNVQANKYQNGTYSVNVAQSSGDAGGRSATFDERRIGSFVTNQLTCGNHICAYFYNVVETYRWSDKLLQTLQRDYRVTGFVVWPK